MGATGSPAASSRSETRFAQLALGLAEIGIARRDKIAILANTRPEWTYFDFAVLFLEAVSVPSAPTTP